MESPWDNGWQGPLAHCQGEKPVWVASLLWGWEQQANRARCCYALRSSDCLLGPSDNLHPTPFSSPAYKHETIVSKTIQPISLERIFFAVIFIAFWFHTSGSYEIFNVSQPPGVWSTLEHWKDWFLWGFTADSQTAYLGQRPRFVSWNWFSLLLWVAELLNFS